jgi:hypothetical protein
VSDSVSELPKDNLPEEVSFALRTRTLVKMGIPFDDPRMASAVTQLYIWPQLLFDLVPGEDGKYLVEVQVEEPTRNVIFNLTLATVPDKANLDSRGEHLTAWCQQLLGEDWSVCIQNRKNGSSRKYKTLYLGDRRKPLEAAVPLDPKAPFPEPMIQFHRYRQDNKSFGFDDNMDLGPIL